MPYIALRPCRFDRPYFIGETIPDEVVDPARAEGLIAMGRIQRTFAQESGESGAELQGADSAPEEPASSDQAPEEPASSDQAPEEPAGQAQEGADSAPEGGDTGEDEKNAEKPAEAKAARKKTSAKK